jgi:ATP phosphoribosyltransferase
MKLKVMELFGKAGLPIRFEAERSNIGKVDVQWISQVVFERPQEIPDFMAEGYFDVAIAGEDWLADCNLGFPTLLSMAIGRKSNRAVNIIMAVSKENPAQTPNDLPSKSIVATEYARLAEKFFRIIDRPDIIIKPSYGNTEAKIRYGTDGIIDVTETGSSLEANGLKIIGTIMKSNTVIIANPKSLEDEKKWLKIDWFARLIEGAYIASVYMGITANVPETLLDRAAKIIGGLKGPTRAPLHGPEGWYALNSFVPKKEWDLISFELLQIGVEDIVPTWEIPCVMRSMVKIPEFSQNDCEGIGPCLACIRWEQFGGKCMGITLLKDPPYDCYVPGL